MSDCNHDCSSCSANCGEREGGIPKEPVNAMSSIRKVIGVVSGKGGVGKSLVTSLLAVNGERNGYKTAILDADVTGPSIPNAFGIHGKAEATEDGLFPAVSAKGTEIMSINLLLEDEKDPVVWRGPVIAGVVKQFWTDVMWGAVDFMFVDMPPGTGDVPLTVFQSLPVDGIVIVTSPQELVGMIVGKAVRMAELMHVPVLGIVENMSYFECPDCGRQHKLFGESRVDEFAEQYGIDTVCRLPINPKLAAACDKGTIELFEGNWLDALSAKLEGMLDG
ncbi:Chromosome partitioning ATPase, Mrp family, contains Fe-S cluster [Ruminococcaceae bacterium FB2012]|nr:Chromosome partitioning ATPase, Mrp family, contains Fe-S cluster [Ruminococcaceae bacterium FB2012]